VAKTWRIPDVHPNLLDESVCWDLGPSLRVTNARAVVKG
jgi:hypothetical protein